MAIKSSLHYRYTIPHVVKMRKKRSTFTWQTLRSKPVLHRQSLHSALALLFLYIQTEESKSAKHE